MKLPELLLILAIAGATAAGLAVYLKTKTNKKPNSTDAAAASSRLDNSAVAQFMSQPTSFAMREVVEAGGQLNLKQSVDGDVFLNRVAALISSKNMSPSDAWKQAKRELYVRDNRVEHYEVIMSSSVNQCSDNSCDCTAGGQDAFFGTGNLCAGTLNREVPKLLNRKC